MDANYTLKIGYVGYHWRQLLHRPFASGASTHGFKNIVLVLGGPLAVSYATNRKANRPHDRLARQCSSFHLKKFCATVRKVTVENNGQEESQSLSSPRNRRNKHSRVLNRSFRRKFIPMSELAPSAFALSEVPS